MYMDYFLYLNTLPNAEKSKQIITIIIFLIIFNLIVILMKSLKNKKIESVKVTKNKKNLVDNNEEYGNPK